MELFIQVVLVLGVLVFADALRRFFAGNKDILFNKSFRKTGSFFWFLGLRKVKQLLGCLLLGFACLGWSAYGTADHYSFYGDAISTMGAVDHIEDSVPGYPPVLTVKFTDQKGQTASTKVSNTSSSDEFKVGENLEIFYQPDNETVAQLEDRFWGYELILALGIILLILGWSGVRSTSGSITD